MFCILVENDENMENVIVREYGLKEKGKGFVLSVMLEFMWNEEELLCFDFV